MLKRQSTRPNGPVLLTLALFAAASTLSACGGSAAPVQPIRGSGGSTPTPKPTPTPVTSPTPPPSGGVSVACVLTLASTGKTYAFVPANSATNVQGYPDSLAEVTIATGTTIAGSRRSAAQLPRRYHRVYHNSQRHGQRFLTTTATAVSPIITYTPSPAECAADGTHDNLYLMSNGSDYPASPVLSIVSVNPSTAAFAFVTNFTTDATTSFSYSGGTFDIGGIVYDPKQTGVVISTSTGYEVYSTTSPYAKSKAITGFPSENFGFNPVTDQIYSPVYEVTASDLALADLNTLTYYTNTADPSGIEDPDSGAVDSTTNIAVSPEEFEQAVYIENLNGLTTSGTTYTSGGIQTLVISGPLVTGIVDQSGAGLTDVSIDSTAHAAFMAGEFGTTGFCVVGLPTAPATGVPAVSAYKCATFPTTPDDAPFSAPLDPHATGTFDLGGKAYGIMFNDQDTYVAVIDLAAMLAATPDPTDPHAVTSGLSSIVSYVQI